MPTLSSADNIQYVYSQPLLSLGSATCHSHLCSANGLHCTGRKFPHKTCVSKHRCRQCCSASLCRLQAHLGHVHSARKRKQQFLYITMHGSAYTDTVAVRVSTASRSPAAQPRQIGSSTRAVRVNRGHVVHESSKLGDAKALVRQRRAKGWRSLEARSSRERVFSTKHVGKLRQAGLLVRSALG
jgi:hypothetical protein